MPQIRNVVEHSLASLINPELAEQRRSSIKAIENLRKRYGALAIHDLVAKFPRTAERLVGNDTRFGAVEYVGSGADHIVYRFGVSVVKVHQRSIDMEESQRQQLLTSQQLKFGIMAAFVSSMLLDQTIDIGQHPLRPSDRAVRITQPYCPHTPTTVFTQDSFNIDQHSLEQLLSSRPELEQPLVELAKNSLAMYQAARLVPDLTGRQNVVIPTYDEGLIIIDGQPIDESARREQERSLSQAQQLLGLMAA